MCAFELGTFNKGIPEEKGTIVANANNVLQRTILGNKNKIICPIYSNKLFTQLYFKQEKNSSSKSSACVIASTAHPRVILQSLTYGLYVNHDLSTLQNLKVLLVLPRLKKL